MVATSSSKCWYNVSKCWILSTTKKVIVERNQWFNGGLTSLNGSCNWHRQLPGIIKEQFADQSQENTFQKKLQQMDIALLKVRKKTN